MDPIANMIVAIKNGYLAKKEQAILPYSKFTFEVAKALEKEGFVGKVAKEGIKLTITLSYNATRPRLNEIKIVSKPGLRVYSKSKKIMSLKGGRGSYIISTPKGVMSGKDAKAKNLGGEVVCLAW